jgi:hypothetical protein
MQVMKKMKGNRSCNDVSPRKKMAMEGTMGKDSPRKFQAGGMVDSVPARAMQVGREMAAQMAGMRSQPMSSGRMRPMMRKERMV